MKTISKQIFSLGLLLLATACTQEQLNENGQLPDGVYPLQIASVCVGGEGGAATRVAENNDGSGSVFETADIFYVQFANNSKAGKYRITDDVGHCDVENAIYWVSTNTYLTGWYPESGTISLQNQNGGLAYVLKATTDRMDYTTQPALTFANQLAKVRVVFDYYEVDESASAFDEVQIKSYTSCTHEKGVIALPVESKAQDYISMQKVTYNGKTYWEANLVPGTLIASDALKFKKNGAEETISLQNDVLLEAGKMSLLRMVMSNGQKNVLILDGLTGNVTISENTILCGKTSYKITIGDGKEVTLLNATVNNQIKCEGDATIHLLGENVVTCSTNYRAGIEAGPGGKTLKIDGSGRLAVKGGLYGAGIGSGGDGSSCGAITINGGTFVATGGSGAAGIGSGGIGTSCGAITINGGTFVATGGSGAAGIGSGYYNSSCGAITINGGTFVATGGSDAAGIGSGYYRSSCGAITINGETIEATGGRFGAGIGSGDELSSCGAITITGVNNMKVTAGEGAACVGGAEVGGIQVTNSIITLDNSALRSSYFKPSPTDITGSTFYDKDGNVITL